MMRIHTTQNLKTLGLTIQPTNVVSSKDIRFNHLQNQEEHEDLSKFPSFQGRKPKKSDLTKYTKKVVVEAKKIVGDISKTANDDKKFGDGLLKSKSFDKALGIAEHETLVQALISVVVCTLFRPLTIVAISNKKSKQDNQYAAAHSIASGLTGIITALFITNPFKNGEKHAANVLLKDFSEKTLQRMYPHLDISSIKNANGTRKEIEAWTDKEGNRFVKDLKDVAKIPKFKDFAGISEETYKMLGADVDWAAMKGKSFNDVVTKDGKSLYETINWKKVGIQVNDKGSAEPISILCKNLDREFLEGIVKDAETGSNWKKLDINSVYGSDGLVKDFREWKEVGTGNQWKLDLDNAFISSELETADYIPEISGKVRRTSDKSGETKFACYIKNSTNDRLGTEITQAMHDADASTTVESKALTWIPDIVTRPLIATGTIALIPWVLKNVFHIEKSTHSSATTDKNLKNAEKQDVNKDSQVTTDNSNNANSSFKGAKDKGAFSFSKLFAKWYGKPMYECDKVRTISEKLSEWQGEKMTQHFSALGSFVTSGVYVSRTINNKDLDAEKRKTLALNQGLCFIVPTICAYAVDKMLEDITKKIEYRYSGLKEQEMAKLCASGNAIDKQKINEITGKLATNLKGVRIFSGLITFTLIYRYLSPVLMTPLANKISGLIKAHKAAKAEEKLMAAQNNTENLKLANA